MQVFTNVCIWAAGADYPFRLCAYDLQKKSGLRSHKFGQWMLLKTSFSPHLFWGKNDLQLEKCLWPTLHLIRPWWAEMFINIRFIRALTKHCIWNENQQASNQHIAKHVIIYLCIYFRSIDTPSLAVICLPKFTEYFPSWLKEGLGQGIQFWLPWPEHFRHLFKRC